MLDVNNSNQSVQRRELFIHLYQRAFPVVAQYVSRMGGSFDQARDVFQDALVVYYEKVIVVPAVLSNDIGYLIGISKNLWLKRYRDAGRHTVPLEANDTNMAWADDQSPSSKRIFRFLEVAGRKCMDLLKAFYYDQMPLKEIAEKFGYSGIRSATAQKFKCLEKVREKVKEKALVYDDFME